MFAMSCLISATTLDMPDAELALAVAGCTLPDGTFDAAAAKALRSRRLRSLALLDSGAALTPCTAAGGLG
jgi:hypothetical protein